MCLKNCIIVLSLPSKPLTCVTNRTLGEGGITLRLKHHKISIVAPYIYIDNVHSTNDLVGIFFLQYLLQSMQLMMQGLVMNMACNALTGVVTFPLQDGANRHP